MANAKESSLPDKTYIGDWAATDKDILVFDHCTEASRLHRSKTLGSFKLAFHPACDQLLHGGNDEREYHQCLDIGCGPGSFTIEHLLPCLPASCQKLVAVDNSEAMLEAARTKCPDGKITYKRLDIAEDADVARFIIETGRFEIVFSFAALHWIQDQHHAVGNIAKLVAPGGECFLGFASGMPLFDIYAAMIKSPVWSNYSEHIKKLIPVTHGMDILSLRSYIASLVSGANLTPLTCEVFSPSLDLKVSAEEIADFYTTANAIYRLISDEKKEELKKFTLGFLHQLTTTSSGTLLVNLKGLVIHAYKPGK